MNAEPSDEYHPSSTRSGSSLIGVHPSGSILVKDISRGSDNLEVFIRFMELHCTLLVDNVGFWWSDGFRYASLDRIDRERASWMKDDFHQQFPNGIVVHKPWRRRPVAVGVFSRRSFMVSVCGAFQLAFEFCFFVFDSRL